MHPLLSTVTLVVFVSLAAPITTAFTINRYHTTSATRFRPFPSLQCPNVASHQRHALPLFQSQNNNNSPTQEDTELNPLTKASWYAVEAFGKVFGNKDNSAVRDNSDTTNAIDLNQKPSSIEEALRRIEMDNERSYFLSGKVDVQAYDEECIFSDPFVSFSGRQRFVDNLANLGSFITEYDARMLSYNQDEVGTTVQTKLMVKLRLNLPWKPVLAWPWGVRYSIDPNTFLITEHEESWDVAPLEGVKQIFRPGKMEIKKLDK